MYFSLLTNLIINHFTCGNISVKKEKELALKEYQSLETKNKHLKAQVRDFSMLDIFRNRNNNPFCSKMGRIKIEE